MENLNPQDVVSNLEAKAVETANAAIEAKSVDFTAELEAKSAELTQAIEGKVNTADLELVQKSIDDLASEVKNFNTKSTETMPTNELRMLLLYLYLLPLLTLLLAVKTDKTLSSSTLTN